MLTLKSPTQTGYGFALPGALSSILEGSQSLSRKDKERNAVPVNVSWTLNDYGYQYMRSFYRGVTLKGCSPFLIPLVLQNSQLDTYTAFFQQGSFRLSSVLGDSFVVSATLEVVPNVSDDAYNASVFAVNQAFGDDTSNALNLFNVIVNVNWPHA